MVTRITPDLIRGFITRDGTLYVPNSITSAVKSCLVSAPAVIREEGRKLAETYRGYQNLLRPIQVDYNGAATVDAYTVFYLPRNSLVPKMAILCCAYDSTFQDLPKVVRVLDIGSGTGGVVLGLLDLFKNDALSGTRLDILAVDVSEDALKRQIELVDRIGKGNSSVQFQRMDLSDPAAFADRFPKGAQYDMVFVANVFTELGEKAIDSTLTDVAPLISDNGILVSVEAQRDYTKRLRAKMVNYIRDLGLHVYYPCPLGVPCQAGVCWGWRTDEFKCPTINYDGNALIPTNVQKASWMILSRKPRSIYDVFRANNPQLVWGMVNHMLTYQGDNVEVRYEFCEKDEMHTGQLLVSLEEFRRRNLEQATRRGNFIGVTRDGTRIAAYWDIVCGFVAVP